MTQQTPPLRQLSGAETQAFVADPRHDPRLPLDRFVEIDGICQQFEEELAGGQSPCIESYLELPSAAGRRALLRELLALELEYAPAAAIEGLRQSYAQRFPGETSLVQLVLGERQSCQRGTALGDQCEAVPDFLRNHPRYQVQGLLGRGGMGAVYLARHRTLDRDVALKVIRPELLAAPEAAGWFQHEAKVIARLNHPNIVTVYDAEKSAGEHFLVMERLVGADLARLVKERGPLPVDVACDYACQTAAGLQYAHEKGVVHRDINPRNLMLVEDGRIKILDFGLAQIGQVESRKDDSQPDSQSGLVGSIDFMAPEQAADSQTADIRADIYSLGCTLWYLLTGEPPFPGGALTDKIERHRNAPVPELGTIWPDAPPALGAALKKMLAKRPADRFAAPRDVVAALRPLLEKSDENASRPNPPRRISWWLVPTTVALATAIGLALHALRAPQATDRTAVVRFASPEAERNYREGLRLISERKEAQAQSAVARFRKAIALSPGSAAAHTALSEALNICGDYGWIEPEQAFPEAKSAALSALSLDPDSSGAHLALAFVLHSYECDFPAAEAEFQRAIQLDPRSAAARHWHAWLLADRGQNQAAADEIAKAHELAPDDLIIVNNVGKLRFMAGDFAGAARQHRYALELDPDFRKAHHDLALAYTELGQTDDALAELDKSHGLTTDDRDWLAARAYVLARAGRNDEALAAVSQLLEIGEHKPMEFDLALAYTALGDQDNALSWLRRCVSRHCAARADLNVEPRLAALRRDPRWREIDEAIGGKR